MAIERLYKFVDKYRNCSKFHRARVTMMIVYSLAFTVNIVVPAMDYRHVAEEPRRHQVDALVFTLCVSISGVMVSCMAAAIRHKKLMIAGDVLLFLNLALSAYGFKWSTFWSVFRLLVNVVATFGTLTLVMILNVDESTTAERLASLQDMCNQQLPSNIVGDEELQGSIAIFDRNQPQTRAEQPNHLI